MWYANKNFSLRTNFLPQRSDHNPKILYLDVCFLALSQCLHFHLTAIIFELNFYPRNAMLALVIVITTCPSVGLSVCHEPCQNEES